MEQVATVSIVLYKTPHFLIKRLMDCISNNNLIKSIYIVDNSPSPLTFDFKVYKNTIYLKNKNIGYGSSHNVVLRKIINESTFHFVLNPDIYFDANVLDEMILRMASDSRVGLMMPKVLYPNGDLQYLCKLLPTPINLFFRRFPIFFIEKYINKINNIYELKLTGYEIEMNVPILSGCFMLFRVDALKKVGLFDERFFMYAEDMDISRRMHVSYQTIYYPKVSIIHAHAKDSFKNFKMLMLHILSVIKYFNKWGWFFDSERNKVNKLILKKLRITE